jgi:hypothetical protein
MEAKELASKIRKFLEEHGKRDVNTPTDWNSPDAYELEKSAFQLENDLPVTSPWSEFGSGGYAPYNDEVRLKHDYLIMGILHHVGKNN